MAPTTAAADAGLEPPGLTVAEAYLRDRRRLILLRLHWTAFLALVPIALGTAVNVLVFSERLPERLATFATETAICLLALGLSRRPALERWATGVAMAFVLGMGTALIWALSLSPRDLDVLVCAVAMTMVAATLIFPWGGAVQAVVSLYVTAGYVAIVPWPALDPVRTTNIAIGLALGVGISAVGALILDRQRWATFVERERVAHVAHQRELLLDVGRQLNSTLELSQVVARITDLGHRLVGSDSVSLTLLDEQRALLRVVGRSTDQPERNQGVESFEFAIEDAAEFIGDLRRRRILEIPGGTRYDGLGRLITARFGFARTLYVTIQRDDRFFGFLNFSQRAAEPAFSEPRVRLAEGIAHQAAIALANARLVDDLQTANRVKSEFVSTMSHELRTPLHVIIGYADLLGDIPESDRPRAIDKIRHASQELLEMIEATLNLNRLETGKDLPRLETVRVDDLWEELASEFAALPQKRGLALRWEPPGDASLFTDRRKLKVVVKNLVGNALKFTERGEVVAACRTDGATCTFTVRDTGVGIAKDHLALIFEMFQQVDSSDSRSYGGMGLGLYIVRRLVDQLGGEVSVESEVGLGSTFTITLPAARAAASPVRPPRAAASA